MFAKNLNVGKILNFANFTIARLAMVKKPEIRSATSKRLKSLKLSKFLSFPCAKWFEIKIFAKALKF